MENAEWDPDAWIFLAIGSANAWRQADPGASLDAVIGQADYINRAIPTDDELEHAVNYLVEIGLVRCHEGRFGLTRSGEEFMRLEMPKGQTTSTMWHLVAHEFHTRAWPRVTTSAWRLQPGEARQAYTTYDAHFQDSLAKLKETSPALFGVGPIDIDGLLAQFKDELLRTGADAADVEAALAQFKESLLPPESSGDADS